MPFFGSSIYALTLINIPFRTINLNEPYLAVRLQQIENTLNRQAYQQKKN